MPALDLSFLLSDPDLCEAFTVYRRTQVVGQDGYASAQEKAITAFGSIQPKDTAIGGNVIEQSPDGSYRAAALTVHTAFRLRSVTQDVGGVTYLPDHVVFDGGRYLVELVNDYAHYGQGFVQADLGAIDILQPPPQ